MKAKIKMLIAVVAIMSGIVISARAATAKLEFIKPPKAPPTMDRRLKLHPASIDNWNKYEVLYNKFMRAAQFIEAEHKENGEKDQTYVTYIAKLNELAKSVNWKHIASMEPARVTNGLKQLSPLVENWNQLVIKLRQTKKEKAANEQNVQRPIISIEDQIKLSSLNPQPYPRFNGDGKLLVGAEKDYYDLQNDIQNIQRQISQLKTQNDKSPTEKANQRKMMIREIRRLGIIAEGIRTRAAENGEKFGSPPASPICPSANEVLGNDLQYPMGNPW